MIVVGGVLAARRSRILTEYRKRVKNATRPGLHMLHEYTFVFAGIVTAQGINGYLEEPVLQCDL
jgi:hypothetical protein